MLMDLQKGPARRDREGQAKFVTIKKAIYSRGAWDENWALPHEWAWYPNMMKGPRMAKG